MRVRHDDERPPRPRLSFQESRVALDYLHGRRAEKGLIKSYPGDGSPVLFLPGMFSSDKRTKMLRRVIGNAGYSAFGWELGRNMPHRTSMILDLIDRRMDAIEAEAKGAVTIIGWSLGGLIAREYAKAAPERVAAVITMGSPFSGNPRFNNAWKLYELFARHKVEASPFAHDLATKPPVHTTAIWSAQDGVIPPRAARGLAHERDEAIEVRCGHLGYVCAPDALETILKVLRAQSAQ